MKKVFILFIGVLTMSVSNSQNINDVVRYSTENLNGTARFKAMSGAFGALGGDFSAFSINPSGSAVFATSEVAISLSNYNNDNNVSYFGTVANRNESEFDLNQAGIVFVFNNMGDSDWRKISLACFPSKGQTDNCIPIFSNSDVFSSMFTSFKNWSSSP